MSVVLQNASLLLDGLWVTIQVTIGAGAVALVLAFVAGLSRLSRSLAIRTAALCYIEFFRGTSALVQLFWLFFALPFLGITLSPMTAGIRYSGFCVGAYGVEIVRSACSCRSQGADRKRQSIQPHPAPDHPLCGVAPGRAHDDPVVRQSFHRTAEDHLARIIDHLTGPHLSGQPR